MQDEEDDGVQVQTVGASLCEACARPVVRDGLAVNDCWRLPCGHFYCGVCLPEWLHATLPLAPLCGASAASDACGQDVEQCHSLRTGEQAHGGRALVLPDYDKICFPPAHRQYNQLPSSGDGARPSASFAATISVAADAGVRHYTAAFNVEPGAAAPKAHHRGALLVFCHYIGLVLLAWNGMSASEASCFSAIAFAELAINDDSLLHDCVMALFLSVLDPAAFSDASTEIFQTGSMPKPLAADLATASVLRAAASMYTIVEIVRKTWRKARVNPLGGLIGALVHSRNTAAADGGLAAMGLGVSAAARHNADAKAWAHPPAAQDGEDV